MATGWKTLPTERPLTDVERAQLAGRVEKARNEARLALPKTGLASALVCGVLALLTVGLSDAPLIVIVPFWTGLAIVFFAWIGLPSRRLMAEQVKILEDALHTNRARVALHVQSDRVVEFEEEEDEGACYAFELRPDTTVFISGQEFYEDDDFPNSDFSIIEILGRTGRPVDVSLLKQGRKITPLRVVPARVKDTLNIPEHLTVVTTPIDRIETALSAGSKSNV